LGNREFRFGTKLKKGEKENRKRKTAPRPGTLLGKMEGGKPGDGTLYQHALYSGKKISQKEKF